MKNNKKCLYTRVFGAQRAHETQILYRRNRRYKRKEEILGKLNECVTVRPDT